MTFSINSLVPELWCSDFEDSLKFYTEILGFTVAQRRLTDPHAYLSLQGSQIMVAWWEPDGTWEPWVPEPLERPYGRGINLQFMVDNVRDIHAAVLSAGLKPFLELHTTSIWRTDRMDKRTQFMLLDPDGYLLRFAQVDSYRSVEQSDIEELERSHAEKI